VADLGDYLNELIGGRDATEDSSRLLCGLNASVVKGGVSSSGAVLKKKALESSVVGVTHGRGDAHVSGDTSEDEVLDASIVEDDAEVSGVERSLSGLINDGLIFVWLEFGDDIPTGLLTNKNATASNVAVTNSSVHSSGSPTLVGWKVRKIRAVTFSGVDDNITLFSEDLQQIGDARDDDTVSLHGFRIHASEISIERAEINLHINDDESGVVRADVAIVGPWIRVGGDKVRLSSRLQLSNVRVDDGGETEGKSELDQVMFSDSQELLASVDTVLLDNLFLSRGGDFGHAEPCANLILFPMSGVVLVQVANVCWGNSVRHYWGGERRK